MAVIRRYQTAPQLFSGIDPSGDESCFYCAGVCDPIHPAAKVVKKSFTGLDTVTLSDWVCPGCIEAMNEKADITLADGTNRSGQKTRMYSWVVTSDRRIAATKSHREYLLATCIDPPSPPFVISISDSGQKQLLYRAVVNNDRDIVTVTLEGEPISYRPDELADRVRLCKQVIAAVGKVAIRDTLSPQSEMRIVEHHNSDAVLIEWAAVSSQPLTRLAVWLCPPKEDCSSEYPSAADADSAGKRGQRTFSWPD